LTHKEKKELKKKKKMQEEMDRITKKGGEGHSELGANFTVAQALKTGGALAQLETAVDIKIDKFSIAAKGKDLFRDASLLIAAGRRYKQYLYFSYTRLLLIFPDIYLIFRDINLPIIDTVWLVLMATAKQPSCVI
jgi:hypothetical protein